MGREGERKRLGRGRQGLDRRKRAVVGEVEVEDELEGRRDDACAPSPRPLHLVARLLEYAAGLLSPSPSSFEAGG